MPLWILPTLKSRWLHYGLLALACAILWMRGNAWERTAETWKTAHAAQKEAFQSAATAARLKAVVAKLQAENRYKELARSNDETLDEMRGEARAAADRYAAGHRLRPQATGPACGGPAAAPTGGDPGEPERPGAGAELLAISQRDFDILVENTVRLEAAHAWAKTLSTDVPAPEFGH